MPTPEALRAVDGAFEALAASPAGPPGLAWGVVADGRLVHAAGRGTLRVGEDRPPDERSVFRIASMTKSFTAATVLLLRDEGRLGLDDPVERYVPALEGLRGPTRDAPPLAIRHLLTMAGGLATDDPFGDRLQGMPLEAFEDLLRAGMTFAWPPGTAFEYSNLGYGILGRVVTAVAGREYRHVVEERLLRPLGMADSTFLPDEVPPDRSAGGYVRRDEQWIPEPIDPYGALAAMGGILTSVADLARWVAWLADAFPARDDPDAGPLARASRREMQQVHRAFPPELSWGPAGVPALTAGGYGCGLFVLHDLELGTTVGHGGGYPGFGSHMRWHPATGLGVVALGNVRYAQVHRPTEEALRALVRAGDSPVRRVRPAPATERLRDIADRLVEAWDDALADAVFAPNMDLDEPRDRRRDAVAAARDRLGALRPDDQPAESESPAHVRWWLRGDRGRLRIGLLATGEARPRIQGLWLTVIPDPPGPLLALAVRVAGLLAEPCPGWPPDVPLAPGTDGAALVGALRRAAVLVGPATLGRPVGGDGERSVVVELAGAAGRGELRLEVDEAGSVVRAEIVPASRSAPPESP